MAYEIEFFKTPPGVVVTYFGDVTEQDLIDSVIERFGDSERAKNLIYSIGDFTNSATINIRTENVKKIGATARDLLDRNSSLLFVVVAPSDLAFGLGRMWEAYSDVSGDNVHIFRERAKADHWLNEQLRNRSAPPKF
jgi:hypothetical protein